MISNPNLVSQIAKLPHLSDEQLKSYINDKSNPLSPFALATLQSKAIARKKFGTPEVPKQTVADQVEAEADAPLGIAGLQGQQPAPAQQMPPPPIPMQQPQAPAPQGMAGGGMVAFDEGGVASLPLRDDMYNEDSFAHGGIVGFDGGGSIYSRMYGQEPDQFGNIIVNGELVNIRDLPMSNLGTIGQPAKASKSKSLTSIPTLSDVLGSTPHGTATEIKQTQLHDPANWGIPPSVAPVDQPLVNWQQTPTGKPPKTKAPASKDVIAEKKPVPPGGVANLLRPQATGLSPYTVEEYIPEAIKSPDAFDRAKYNEERKQAMIDAGVDPKFYDKQVAKNEKERQKLKDERTDAGWTAALRAGLGMMGGKSQNPWTNIAEGATAGLTQYGADIKDIKSEEKALRAADDKLAEAQYLQGRGDAEGALKAMKEREALIASVDAMNVQARNVSKTAYVGDKNKMRSDVFKNEQENTRLAIQQAGETERSRNQIAASERATKATQDLNLSFKQQESYNKAIDNTNAALTLQYGAGFGGTMPPEEYSKIYFTELKKQQAQLGLKPLVPNASISGMPEGAIFKGSRPAK